MNKDIEAEIEEIVAWTASQAKRLVRKGALLEIGGDINSAVALAMTKRTFGDEARGLILACRDRTQWVQDAQWIARHLDTPYELLDITPFFENLMTHLRSGGKAKPDQVKSSLKMMVHRCSADARELIMVGAGDRLETEFARIPGHPDPLADLLPIGHLLKRDIRKLGRYLGLPRRILEKPRRLSLPDLHGDRSSTSPTVAELDAYLAGDFSRISIETLQSIESSKNRILPSRHLPLRNLELLESSDPNQHATTDHDTYDRSIEALSLISKAITSDQYLEDILRLIVMVTAEVMKSSVCSLWLLDEKESVLRLRATQSIDSEYLKDRVLKVGEGIVGKVALENRAYAVPNVLLDPIFKEKDLARRMGLVSMLSIPMRVGERVIGVINCYTSHPHVFSDLQMNLLTTVANQAAVAIEKTELMVKTKVISEELERRKVIERAKDLLMKRLSLSGEEAYRWLQKRSMNTRKSMREVSEAVLLAMEG
jgi:NAD+ synthetase